jgi:hypothetical protein
MLHHVAPTEAAQRVDVFVRDAAETELVRNFVEDADEPGERVGERAVEVEYYQVVFFDFGFSSGSRVRLGGFISHKGHKL